MQQPADASKTTLQAALLDYGRSPGKYQVGLLQPQLLFAQLREVLQIAVGREGDILAGGGGASSSLRDAARFFVRTALLYPGADHYAVLGLNREAEPADLKDRYRLLMRLLHPDFAEQGMRAWPGDSAVRVNLAYDTLSSAVERREYDERFGLPKAASAAHAVEPMRVRPVAAPSDAGDTRQSHFKKLAVACAVAGGALVIVSLFATGSPDTGQLVQRTPAPLQEVRVAMQEPPWTAAALPVVAALKEPPRAVPVQLRSRPLPPPPAPKTAPQPLPEQVIHQLKRPAEPTPAPRFAEAPARQEPALVPVAVVATVVPPIAPAPAPTPMPVVTTAVTAPIPQPPSAPARPALKPGPTLVQAQPLLSQLLQVMESGRGERILSLLDAETRAKPSAQALSRQYDTLVDGARPVRVSHVELKSEPGDGRLLVVGYLRLLAGEQAIGALGKKMVLRAEFASREGTVVITGLSGGPVN